MTTPTGSAPDDARVPTPAPIPSQARLMPAPAAPATPTPAPVLEDDLDDQRDHARTELLLEQLADDDLAEHRARVDVGATITGRLIGAAW